MNRNADLSHDRHRNLSTISVRQLPGQTNGLSQAARDDRQPTGQQPKSPEPETSPIVHDLALDPDRPHPARNALAHRRPFSGSFPTRRLVDAPSRTPTSIAFSASRPEPALNSNCSLVRSGRGGISLCSSFGTACPRPSLPNSISCTPPPQRERGRMPEDP